MEKREVKQSTLKKYRSRSEWSPESIAREKRGAILVPSKSDSSILEEKVIYKNRHERRVAAALCRRAEYLAHQPSYKKAVENRGEKLKIKKEITTRQVESEGPSTSKQVEKEFAHMVEKKGEKSEQKEEEKKEKKMEITEEQFADIFDKEVEAVMVVEEYSDISD